MFNGIQSQSPLQSSRRITESISHKTMRNLMDDDRKYENNDE